jgi:hypothetical protein
LAEDPDMGMNKTPLRIELSDEEHGELERLTRSHAIPHRTVVRAQTILRLAAGEAVSSVARAVGRDRKVVRKWACRFIRQRLRGGLDDLPRSGRPARFSPQRGRPLGEARM